MKTHGFTLLELLVVIAVIGLMASIAFPAVDRSIRAQAFNTGALQLDLAVRQARADAIRQRQTIAVPDLSSPGDRRSIKLDRTVLPTGIIVEKTAMPRFYRDGTSDGGMIEIGDGQRKFRITVDAQTGVVSSGRTK